MAKKQTKKPLKKTSKRPARQKMSETDSKYFLKLAMFVVLGSFWLKFATPLAIGPLLFNGLPLGLILGIWLASHDRFQIDRKIEYAILVLMAVITYFNPAGIVV